MDVHESFFLVNLSDLLCVSIGFWSSFPASLIDLASKWVRQVILSVLIRSTLCTRLTTSPSSSLSCKRTVLLIWPADPCRRRRPVQFNIFSKYNRSLQDIGFENVISRPSPVAIYGRSMFGPLFYFCVHFIDWLIRKQTTAGRTTLWKLFEFYRGNRPFFRTPLLQSTIEKIDSFFSCHL